MKHLADGVLLQIVKAHTTRNMVLKKLALIQLCLVATFRFVGGLDEYHPEISRYPVRERRHTVEYRSSMQSRQTDEHEFLEDVNRDINYHPRSKSSSPLPRAASGNLLLLL